MCGGSEWAWGSLILNPLSTSYPFDQKNLYTHLNFTIEIPLICFPKKNPTLKFCLKFTGKSLYKIVLKKNPCKIYSLFRKGVNFTKETPLIFFQKKINSEIWPQKYPLGSTS